MFALNISGPAERDIVSAYQWWKSHRSEQQAERWYETIRKMLKSLERDPNRFPLATESEHWTREIRQLNVRVGRRITHRIVFEIKGNTIDVLRVRHTSQGDLTLEDL